MWADGCSIPAAGNVRTASMRNINFLKSFLQRKIELIHTDISQKVNETVDMAKFDFYLR